MTSVKFEFNFLAGVYQNDEFYVNNYSLKAHLHIKTLSVVDQQIAFDRMDVAINQIVNDSVFVHDEDVDRINKIHEAGLRVLAVDKPGPIDQIIGVTLTKKLNAICEDYLYIFESELSSQRGMWVKYIYYCSENIEDEELVNSDSDRWWNNPGPVFVSGTTKDLKDMFEQNVSWRDFDLHWEEEASDEVILQFAPEDTAPSKKKLKT